MFNSENLLISLGERMEEFAKTHSVGGDVCIDNGKVVIKEAMKYNDLRFFVCRITPDQIKNGFTSNRWSRISKLFTLKMEELEK